MGRIYEIDTTVTSLTLIDPVQEIAAAFGPLGQVHATIPLWSTHHTGDSDLVAALALGYPPTHPAYGRRGSSLDSAYSNYLRAVIFALRDAEVLIVGNPSSACIVDAWDVSF